MPCIVVKASPIDKYSVMICLRDIKFIIIFQGKMTLYYSKSARIYPFFYDILIISRSRIVTKGIK